MGATWTQVGPPVSLAMLELTTFTEPSVVASTDLVVEPRGQFELGRSCVPRRLVRRHLAHSRSVDLAGVDLGDIGMGIARSGQSRRRVGPAGSL